MRYVSEKSTSNKCEKAGVFSAYNIISDFLAMKMANKCKSLQSKQLSLKKTNPLNNENPQSTDLICVAQLVQGGGESCPPCPPPRLATALKKKCHKIFAGKKVVGKTGFHLYIVLSRPV